MKSVAESLKIQALNANMTINHFQIIFEYHKCCELDQKCCNDAPWYSLAQETMVNTRSTVAINIAVSVRTILTLGYCLCVCLVYVFFGTPKSLVDMMAAMQSLQLFDNGDYMVIYGDTKFNYGKDFRQYLWSNIFNMILYYYFVQCPQMYFHHAYTYLLSRIRLFFF